MLYWLQVMQMDKTKTGELIAAARKEKNLTQKDLAQRLHVSDRAVSKWERGAGFPDVSLLEPLAAALDLNVLDLLRGERTVCAEPETAVKETLAAVREVRRQRRQETWLEAARALPLLLLLWCVLGAFGMLRLPVDRTVTVGVYQNGVMTALTEVRVKGWCVQGVLPWDAEYQGRFWVPLDETAGRVRFRIPISPGEKTHAAHKSWSGNIRGDSPFLGNNFCLTRSMREFALCLTDGTVVATSWEQYIAFTDLYGGVPLDVLT